MFSVNLTNEVINLTKKQLNNKTTVTSTDSFYNKENQAELNRRFEKLNDKNNVHAQQLINPDKK